MILCKRSCFKVLTRNLRCYSKKNVYFRPNETKGGEGWVSFVALVPTSFDLAMISTPRVVYIRETGCGYGSGLLFFLV